VSAVSRVLCAAFAIFVSACCLDYDHVIDVDRSQEPFSRSCDELCAEIFVTDDSEYAGCVDTTREEDGVPVARCTFTDTSCQELH
jgi:hypothetical protein